VTIVVGYVSLQFLHVMQGSFIAFPCSADITWAINHNHAVSTLGYDLLIAIASFILWFSFNTV
jgi:hypothetical protein